tara:strand:- start:218 stop:997 length:780 start_codon:yes stop_codon:yes gene_type:complete
MKVAIIQLNSNDIKSNNINKALIKAKIAVDEGAEFILLPETFNYRGKLTGLDLFNEIAEKIPGESIIPFIELAKNAKVNILAGSIYERAVKKKKIYNTSLLINSFGSVIGKYRKINLFRAIINGFEVDESNTYEPGEQPVMCNVNNMKVGMSICFDIRFPELYRSYYKNSVDIIVVPSSFTSRTGKLHWETLLRARAIENYCYVLAPNQCGVDGNGIKTYGHSMAIDPQGKIMGIIPNISEDILYVSINKISKEFRPIA